MEERDCSISIVLSRLGDVHGYGTRSARAGLYLSTRDHGSVGYRVPEEWRTLTEGQREVGSLAGFKRGSRAGVLEGYGAYVCGGCYVCRGDGGGEDRNVAAREREEEEEAEVVVA